MESTAATSLPEGLSPWHAGEIKLQRHVGVDARMDQVGRRVIRDHLIDQHRDFYPQLPFIVLGAVDAAGDAWATLRANRLGFLQSPDPHTLHLDLTREPGDPADAGMENANAIALLGIELHTRRRNRLNGSVRRAGTNGFDIAVEQSYGNCPQYIQLRDFEFHRDPATASAQPPQDLDRLNDRAKVIIAAADTFFVASYVERKDNGATHRQVDVSHRGGKPGFVRIGEDGVLTIPDFAGNLFFNTLGNILANPKSGLVFADFATGALLQLTGDAEVILDSPEIAAFQGAERLWRFTPRRIVYRPDALPLRWVAEQDGESPNSLLTGSWGETADRLKAAVLAKTWRPFRIARIVNESSIIRSFHLEPTDGAGLIPHQAGQHLPIRVTPSGATAPVMRTYTLSSAPSDGIYRISVKREGLVSTHLHNALKIGDTIEALAPAGQFVIDATERRPAVLLAAGIGVTPMLAMLRHIVYEGLRKRHVRPTWFIYAARSKAERAFAGEIDGLMQSAQGAVKVVRVLSDAEGAVDGADYEYTGRVDLKLLKAGLSLDDYDFYLCGPAGFMQGLYDGLRGLSIADKRIHAEAFGPASLTRALDADAADAKMRAPATKPVAIAFVASGKEARWTPDSGSLLEFAESRGLQPAFSCRGGSCGSCRSKIVEGKVAYKTRPSFNVPDDEALICCAVPAAPEDGGGERLQLDI